MKKLKDSLLKSFVGVMGIRIVASGLGFVLNVLLARLLGVKGLGIYTYALAWHQLLYIPALLGLDNLLIREVAIYTSQSSWGLLRGILRWSNQMVLISSVSIALIAIAIAWNFGFEDKEMLLTFSLAMLLLPIAALRNVRLATMKGLRLVIMGLMPEMLIVPIVIIVLTGCLYLFVDKNITASWVLGTRIVATLITFAIGIYLLNKALPEPVKQATCEYQIRTWSTKLLPFMLLGGMYIITSRCDMLMLGAIKGTEAVGLYGPVTRGVELLAYILTAANNILSPNIASLYSENKLEQLQQLVTRSSRLMLLMSLPIAAILIFGGNWYLSLFGSEFVQARSALTILCIGQLFNVATGSVGVLLTMTGNENYNLIGSVINVLLNIVLNLWWIPNWGIYGAAAATASSTIVVNIVLVILVYKRIGINPIALGQFK
ncbi:flippase [Pleurocapsa sp. FMAR1]|uniref:flippase n=1 Tax=Pleurocapsa sp. FMAR1 TaxID=3040204 RepID=UPI0029C8F47C|nr:flippase [Pleurocapsa sp. FMAR1]